MKLLQDLNEGVKTSDIEGMYGYVAFEDGSEIHLEAAGKKEVDDLLKKLKDKQGLKVTDIGDKDIGEEAHWYIIRTNGHTVLGNRKKVQDFIASL